MKADEFKVGDTVYCVIFGKGKIIDKIYNLDNAYPLKVEFENGIKHSYTQAGKSTVTSNRTLFFEEIKISESAYKRPRYRVGEGNFFYYVDATGFIFKYKDCQPSAEDLFDAGNYFKTEAEAKESNFYKVFHEEE